MPRSKTTIINFPQRTAAIGEDNAFWIIAVRAKLNGHFTCEYDTENENWKLFVYSSTFQGADALVKKCRHILGWDAKEIENASAN